MNFGVKFALVPEKEAVFQKTENVNVKPKSILDHYLLQNKDFSTDLNQKQLEDQLLRRIDIPLDTRMKLYDQMVQKRVFKADENNKNDNQQREKNSYYQLEEEKKNLNEEGAPLIDENIKEQVFSLLSKYSLNKNIKLEKVVNWILSSNVVGRAPNGYRIVLKILFSENFSKEAILNEKALVFFKTLSAPNKHLKNEVHRWRNFE